MKEGWICPRCKRVNSPFVPFCGCKTNERVTNFDSKNINKCDHEWSLYYTSINYDVINFHYRCKYCGERKMKSTELKCDKTSDGKRFYEWESVVDHEEYWLEQEINEVDKNEIEDQNQEIFTITIPVDD